MWKEKLLTLLSSLSRTQLASLGIFLLGLVLLSGGLIYSLSSPKEENEIIFESGSEVQSEKTEEKITVDVEGALLNPGVYTLNPGSRVKDALILAGGFSSDADRGWVKKNLNLALKIADGTKIYIPRLGENVQSVSSNNIQTSGLININSAGMSELDTLSGIGPVTAQKIIDNRPYNAIEDLRTKKIVGQSVFEKIKDKITVY